MDTNDWCILIKQTSMAAGSTDDCLFPACDSLRSNFIMCMDYCPNVDLQTKASILQTTTKQTTASQIY